MQEGDVVPEYPVELLTEADHVLWRMAHLIHRINKTGTASAFDEALTLTQSRAATYS